MAGGLGLPMRGTGVVWRLATALALVVVMVAGTVGSPASVAAATGDITEYPVTTPQSFPTFLAVGSDGALWFTSYGSNTIGRITTAGVITEYPVLTPNSHPFGIAAGSDGALWFTESNVNKIGRITTAGAVTEYSIPTAQSQPVDIAAGPDGALWFTEWAKDKIGRITTSGVITEYPVLTPGSNVYGITAGPDGNLWFASQTSNKIGRITTTGVVTEFPVPTANAGPLDIATGPDGNLWFTEYSGNQIGRITTAGVVTEFPVPTSGSELGGIAAGPDGALWFAESATNQIGRITTAGVVTEYPVPTAASAPTGIVAGPDGALWFAEQGGNQIGRVEATALTQLTQVRGTVTYGDTVGSVSATLTSGGSPLSGKSVSFMVGGVAVCGGATGVTCPTTGANGVASLGGITFPAKLAAGNQPSVQVCATFPGDASYLAVGPVCSTLQVTRRILTVKPTDRTVGLRQPNPPTIPPAGCAPTGCWLELTSGSSFAPGDTWASLNLTNLRFQYSRNPASTNKTEREGSTYRITALGAASTNYELRYATGTLTVVVP